MFKHGITIAIGTTIGKEHDHTFTGLVGRNRIIFKYFSCHEHPIFGIGRATGSKLIDGLAHNRINRATIAGAYQ